MTRRLLLLVLVAASAVLGLPLSDPAGATGPHRHPGAGVTIPDSGPASPSPSLSEDIRRGRSLSGIDITLHDVHHSCVKDLDIVLAHGGRRKMLLSDVGEHPLAVRCHDIHIAELRISDLCPPFPDLVPVAARTEPGLAQLCARPTDVDGVTHGDDAEAGLGASDGRPMGSIFGGYDPSGHWELHVVDDAAGSAGAIGSWSIDITTPDLPPRTGTTRIDVHKGEGTRVPYVRSDPEDGANVGCTVTRQPDLGSLYGVELGCPEWYAARAGTSGTDRIRYLTHDQWGNVSPEGVIELRIVNRPPVAADVTVQVQVGGEVPLPLGGTDPDPAETPTCGVVQTPTLGHLEGDGCDRTFVAARAGTETLYYGVADAFGGQDGGEITVVVTSAAPTAPPVEATVAKGGQVAIALGGPGLTCQIPDRSTSGRGTVTASGCTATYRPDPGARGVDSFAYTVRDAQGRVSPAGTVTVAIANRAPSAPTLAVTVPEGDSAAIALVGTDPDPGEGVALTCQAATGPTALGRVSGTGCFATYRAGAAPGADTFTYTVRDVDGATATGRVDVTIAGTAPAGCTTADTRDARYVCRAYTDLLGRRADASGKAYWIARLARGEHRSAVIKAFTGTSEYRASVVRGIWQAYLGTLPDAATQQRWVAQLGRGANPDLVRREALASDAFYTRAGSAPEGFVMGVHQQLLRRPATPTEIASWADQVRTRGRSDVVGRLLATVDADTATVAAVYERFLRRSPAGETAYWVSRLQAGESELALVRLIVSSPEYHGRA